MKRRRLAAFITVSFTVVAILLTSQSIISAQKEGGKGDRDTPPPFYNPYPSGILPGDLNSEIARVLREIDLIEGETLVQLQTLPSPTLTGQPPILAHTGQRLNVLLGEAMNFDRNISPFKDRACAFCHMPYAGYSGPIPSVNLTMIGYPGSFQFRAGKRNAQRYPYSPSFPVLNFNETQQAFFGGAFWDSRATGYLLGSPDANQAQGPPVDTQEHALPDTACIAFRLQSALYKRFFIEVWGDAIDTIKFPHNSEEICETPGGAAVFGTSNMPIKLSSADRSIANDVYDHWGQSIDQYETSPDVSAFSSKFDAFLEGKYTMTSDEMAGYNLFRGKANCNSCHLDGRSTAPTPPAGTAPNSQDTGAAADTRPVFTCFGSANLGLPLNPRDAIFYQTTPDFFGFTANPFGFGFRDLGLGTFLRSGPGSWASPNDDWTQFAPSSDGKMQTSSARNVAMTPSQCPTTEAPGPYFQKQFFHNGYIKSLKQLVHFYNTRDVWAQPVTSGHCKAGTIEKVTCWPTPEVPNPNTLDMTIGKLGLTDTEENQIVAFLQTLTDGFTRPYPGINAFTGVCMTGGTAATQGNETLIPTPPLPPCATAICGVPPLPSSPIP